MSRRRYQRGSLKDDGDRWEIRYRVDVIVDGVVKRPYKWDVLSKKQYPTKRMAQRELERILAEVNREDYKPLPQVNFAAFARRWQETILILRSIAIARSQATMGQFRNMSRVRL